MSENAIDEIFESYEKYTTMMYRPPEMIDKYKRCNVTTKVDIWVSFRRVFLNHWLSILDDRLCRLHSLLCSAPFYGKSKTSHLHSRLQLSSNSLSPDQAPRHDSSLSHSRPRVEAQYHQAPLHLRQLLWVAFNHSTRRSTPSKEQTD